MINSKHINYEKNYKYRLSIEFIRYFSLLHPAKNNVEAKYFRLYMGWLILHPGYCWDGATGAVDTDNFMRASAVHDAGCQMTDNGLIPYKYRKLFDQELRKMCLEDGMTRTRAWWVYRAVRKYSTDINSRGDKRKIYISPKLKNNDNG